MEYICCGTSLVYHGEGDTRPVVFPSSPKSKHQSCHVTAAVAPSRALSWVLPRHPFRRARSLIQPQFNARERYEIKPIIPHAYHLLLLFLL